MKRRSIAFYVSVCSAAVIAIVLGLYAGYQYATAPGVTAAIFLQQAWHVAVLGTMIYLVMAIVLDRLVVRPLRLMCIYFYEAGLGKGHHVPVETPVKELADIYAWGSSVRRLQDYEATGRLGQISQRVSELKQAADSAAAGDLEHISQLPQLAAKLQQEVIQVQRSLATEAALNLFTQRTDATDQLAPVAGPRFELAAERSPRLTLRGSRPRRASRTLHAVGLEADG